MAVNPYMSNFKEYTGRIAPDKNNNITLTIEEAGESSHKLRASDLRADTMATPAFATLNEEEVAVVKESTREKKKKKAILDIENWLNSSIFENGKYSNIDKNSAISLAKYMFDLGYNFRDTGKFKLK